MVTGWDVQKPSYHLVKSADLGVTGSELEPQIFHLLAGSVWLSHLSNLSMSFLHLKELSQESNDLMYRAALNTSYRKGFCKL